MKEMTARYPGTCIATGRPINPGDPIIYWGTGRAELIVRPVTEETEADDHAHAYLYARKRKWVSAAHKDALNRDWYQNHKGRCEDAPCCGCCN